MHLYVAGRGQYRWLQDWIANLSARYYPYKYAADKPVGMVQLAVRPWQIFEIVFPREALDKVLGIIQPYDGGNTKKAQLTTTGKLMQRVLGLSKFAGLKKIPHVKASPEFPMVNPMNHVGVAGIGIKEDINHPVTGIEML